MILISKSLGKGVIIINVKMLENMFIFHQLFQVNWNRFLNGISFLN